MQRWCSDGKFSDGDLVREKKLLLFLQEVVLPMRTAPRKRKSMAQKMEAKRKRNAASKRHKRAKLAEGKGKNVEGHATGSSLLAEKDEDAHDEDKDNEDDENDEMLLDVSCSELCMRPYLTFHRVSHWLPTQLNQVMFQLLCLYGRIK
jgi:hypothetical protein